MNKTRLRKYANLIARCGVNVQKGQEVIITAECVTDKAEPKLILKAPALAPAHSSENK